MKYLISVLIIPSGRLLFSEPILRTKKFFYLFSAGKSFYFCLGLTRVLCCKRATKILQVFVRQVKEMAHKLKNVEVHLTGKFITERSINETLIKTFNYLLGRIRRGFNGGVGGRGRGGETRRRRGERITVISFANMLI